MAQAHSFIFSPLSSPKLLSFSPATGLDTALEIAVKLHRKSVRFVCRLFISPPHNYSLFPQHALFAQGC